MPKTPEQNREDVRAWRLANPEKSLEQSRKAAAKWSMANPEMYRAGTRRGALKAAGWTLGTYDAAFAAQAGRCSICGAEPVARPGNSHGRLCADHDHATGLPRELLCHACNTALGQLRDNPATAEAAAVYLRKWGK